MQPSERRRGALSRSAIGRALRRPWSSEYDRTKWVAHYRIAGPMVRAGLPLVVVQPGAVYGPGDPSTLGQVLRDYLRRRLLAVPKEAASSWGYVDDIVGGHRNGA